MKLVRMIQNAVSTIFFHEATNWDDLQVSVGRFQFPGVNDPTWRAWDHGLGGPAFTVLGFALNDYIDFTMQTRHSMKLMQDIFPHLHYTLPSDSAADKIKFKLDVIVAGVHGDYAVATGSPYEAEVTLDGTESGKNNVLGLGTIGPANNTVSTLYKCRLTRVAASSDDYAPEVYVDFNDSHVIHNSVGSGQEYVK